MSLPICHKLLTMLSFTVGPVYNPKRGRLRAQNDYGRKVHKRHCAIVIFVERERMHIKIRTLIPRPAFVSDSSHPVLTLNVEAYFIYPCMISKMPTGRFYRQLGPYGGTHHTQKSILNLGVSMYQTELVEIVCDHRGVCCIHVPPAHQCTPETVREDASPVVIRRQSNGNIERPLKVSLRRVHLEQLE